MDTHTLCIICHFRYLKSPPGLSTHAPYTLHPSHHHTCTYIHVYLFPDTVAFTVMPIFCPKLGVCMCVCVCVCVCVHACVCVCMRACAHVCVCVCHAVIHLSQLLNFLTSNYAPDGWMNDQPLISLYTHYSCTCIAV